MRRRDCKVPQPKPQPAVIRGFFATRRGDLAILVMESALQEAIESLDGAISSYTQPRVPYDQYDWQRMQDWYNWRAAYQQLLKQLRGKPKRGRK